ncbi:MAG: DUF11 domain-containing protein [Gemmatimonadetes bacterium]|nr:DUF11 domain-containing protein [Gemmatimonadota bacterium]
MNGVYSLVVTNQGRLASAGTVTVLDTLPTGLSFVSGTGGGFACAAAGQVVTCTSATVIAANGGTSTITHRGRRGRGRDERDQPGAGVGRR